MPNETEKTVIQPTVLQKTSFSWRKIGLLFVIFLIVLLLASEYVFYRYFKKYQMQVTEIVTQLQTAQQQLNADNLPNKFTAADESIQQLQSDVKTLQQTVAQVSQSQQGNQNTLKLMQADYYVQLAHDNVQYMHNIPMAMTLLKLADDIVRDLSDATLDDVRKALANDITTLQNTPQVDVTGLYMRLTAINAQLDKLPLPNQSAEKSSLPDAAQPAQSWWQRGLQNTWFALQKMVVVRYNQNDTLPFVTPEQQVFLYQNLHAMLEQAIWGLLHGQTEIYQQSLQQANEWIKHYFVGDSPLVQTTLNELTELQKINIQPETPAITDSLQAFKGLKNRSV